MKEGYNHEEALELAKQEIQERNGELTKQENLNVDERDTLVANIVLKDRQTIILDFGKLTGNSIINIKKKYAKLRKRNAAMMEEFDDFYYMLVAEYTSGISHEKFLKLPYKDFAKVRNVVRDFLGEED